VTTPPIGAGAAPATGVSPTIANALATNVAPRTCRVPMPNPPEMLATVCLRAALPTTIRAMRAGMTAERPASDESGVRSRLEAGLELIEAGHALIAARIEGRKVERHGRHISNRLQFGGEWPAFIRRTPQIIERQSERRRLTVGSHIALRFRHALKTLFQIGELDIDRIERLLDRESDGQGSLLNPSIRK
jgi:hypothetical protein